MRNLTVRVHSVEEDGLPSRPVLADGRMVFVFDGALISGWPNRVDPRDPSGARILWQGHPDAFPGDVQPREFAKVTHWVEFPVGVETLVRFEPTPEEAAEQYARCSNPDNVPATEVDAGVLAVLREFDQTPWQKVSLRAIVGVLLADQADRHGLSQPAEPAPEAEGV